MIEEKRRQYGEAIASNRAKDQAFYDGVAGIPPHLGSEDYLERYKHGKASRDNYDSTSLRTIIDLVRTYRGLPLEGWPDL